MHSRSPIHLRSGGTSVVIDLATAGFPSIIHWGDDLGGLTDEQLADLATAARPQRVSGGLDTPARLSILPLESAGWQNEPGLIGSRHGLYFSPSFGPVDVTASDSSSSLTIDAVDENSALRISSTLTLDVAGLLHQRHTLTNIGQSGYELQQLIATFPVPASARELLDTTGRHLRERFPQRHAFTTGRHVRDSRRGRPGADATLFTAVGTPGFGFERGLVHAVHLAWSGNQRATAERTVSANALLQVGELFSPGELTLEAGQSYTRDSAHCAR